MARRPSGRPSALIEQRVGAGRHGATAFLQPTGHLLPRHLQPGRGDQLEAENRRARLQRKGPCHAPPIGKLYR